MDIHVGVILKIEKEKKNLKKIKSFYFKLVTR